MPFHGALKRLISLACVIGVLRQNLVTASFSAAAGFGEGLREHSPSAELIMKMNPDADIGVVAYLTRSKEGFDVLHEKIHQSVSKGNYIHVEDGESDDHWHNLLGAMRGAAPKYVFLQGGYYKLRQACYNRIWGHLVARFGVRKPEIHTISGRFKDFFNFDEAEGTGLFKASEIEKLKEESRKGYNQGYWGEISNSQRLLEDFIQANEFTTVVLKTAPAGLVETLAKYPEKVAVVWTGPIRSRRHTDAWEIKFNYNGALEAADKLIKTNIPIVVISPSLRNTRFSAIVDKDYMLDLRKYMDIDPNFHGFTGLASIQLIPEAPFSYYINKLADHFSSRMIKSARKLNKDLDDEALALEQDLTLSEETRRKEEIRIANTRTSKASLGTRWEALSQLRKDGTTFREFCPVDQTAEVVINPKMKSSVQEVTEVEMSRPENHPDKELILLKPKIGGNIFIVTKFNSEKLERNIQHSIDWMSQGEQPKPIDTKGSHSTQSGYLP